MKIRFAYPLAFTLMASLVAACGGSDVQPETPPPADPPPAPVEPAAPAPAEPAAAAPAPAEPAPKKEEAPAPKPLKERLVGVWVLDFSGEVKTAAEADAQKKAGKDEKKLAELMKKAEESTAKQKVENTADTIALWEGDKVTSKAKYEIVKEEGNTITVKRVGKDEISKKDAPAAEVAITFKDDNTIELRDLKEKDAKKAKLLVFKKDASAPAAAASAAPAKGADKGTAAAAPAGATPASAASPAKK